jgi:hypothetical protein
MKKNRTSLIVTLILVIVAVYFLFFKDSFSTLGQKGNDFAVQDTASITKIFLADKNNRNATLTRVGPGKWLINGKYEARSDAIGSLLYTIKMVTVRDVIDPNGIQNVVNGLSSGGIKVEVYKGDERIKLYYVGGPTADNLGTFMLLANPKTGENYKQPYIVYIPGFDGYLTPRFIIPEEDWRDRTIWQYYPYALRSVSITYPQSDSGFQINIIGKNKFDLKNSAGQALSFDTIALKQYLTYYQSVSWNVTVETPKKDSILTSTPMAIIEVKDTTGKTTEVKLFNKKATSEIIQKYGKDFKYDPDQMFALVNNKDFVLAEYYVFGKMLQKFTYFTHPIRQGVEK